MTFQLKVEPFSPIVVFFCLLGPLYCSFLTASNLILHPYQSSHSSPPFLSPCLLLQRNSTPIWALNITPTLTVSGVYVLSVLQGHFFNSNGNLPLKSQTPEFNKFPHQKKVSSQSSICTAATILWAPNPQTGDMIVTTVKAKTALNKIKQAKKTLSKTITIGKRVQKSVWTNFADRKGKKAFKPRGELVEKYDVTGEC